MDIMKTVYAKNSLTGLVDLVPEDHLNHPILGANLSPVRNDKRRGRLADIVEDPKPNQDGPQSSATRLTEPASPDKDKED